MKIMILPSACVPDSGSPVMIARSLAAMFRMENIETAVCADRRSRFSDVSFFASPAPSSFHRRISCGTTIEEYLKAHGAFSASFLTHDYEAIRLAIEDYMPDLLIEIERPAAIAAGVTYGLPVFNIVSTGAFRNRDFKVDDINGLNEFLSNQNLNQVLRFRELYAHSRCFAFGPSGFRSFVRSYKVTSFGSSAIAPLDSGRDTRLSIVLNDTTLSFRKRRQTVTDAFLGAPYEVFVYAKGLRQGRNGNLRFQNLLRFNSLIGSRAVIHDGTDAVTQYCISLGIPEVIVHDDSWQRAWNAACLKRSGAGICVHEDVFSLSSLYESFRQVVSDDRYLLAAENLREEVRALGDLSMILPHVRKFM